MNEVENTGAICTTLLHATVHRMIGRLALQQSTEDLMLAPGVLDISCVGRGTAPKPVSRANPSQSWDAPRCTQKMTQMTWAAWPVPR